MEQARTLTWKGFTKDALYESLRDRIRGKTRKEIKKAAVSLRRYGANQGMADRLNDLEDFSL